MQTSIGVLTLHINFGSAINWFINLATVFVCSFIFDLGLIVNSS